MSTAQASHEKKSLVGRDLSIVQWLRRCAGPRVFGERKANGSRRKAKKKGKPA